MPANMVSTDSRALERFPEPRDIQSLAAFLKPDASAVSFCYSVHSFPDRSHHTEAVAIGKLVQDERAKFAPGAMPRTLSSDLERILEIAEQIQQTPARWRALYACAEHDILCEFDLPAPESAAQLEVAEYFLLQPLLRALQSCRQYKVVLIESRKARLFEVRGTDIQEIAHSLPEGDLSQRSEDSRVGWSKHIDGNIEHQERAWFRILVDGLSKLPGELAVGCRNDLWGELRPYLAELDNDVMGLFHLRSFEASADEVWKEARFAFDKYELERCRNLLHAINEDHEHGVSGLNEVLQSLVGGRVHKLLIGKMFGQMMAECGRCGHIQQETDVSCASCGSSMLIAIPASEALIRAALTQQAEILIYPHDEVTPLLGVAALTRY